MHTMCVPFSHEEQGSYLTNVNWEKMPCSRSSVRDMVCVCVSEGHVPVTGSLLHGEHALSQVRGHPAGPLEVLRKHLLVKQP